MTETIQEVDHIAEVWSDKKGDVGPSGDYVEVIEGELRDYGGNVIFAGSAEAVVEHRNFHWGTEHSADDVMTYFREALDSILAPQEAQS